MSFRLVQMVELAAKTAAYKKSKQGGKLAMRDIADQQGLPSFLVELRHQAVHESSSLSEELMHKAITHLQAYIFSSYWFPIFSMLTKRHA